LACIVGIYCSVGNIVDHVICGIKIADRDVDGCYTLKSWVSPAGPLFIDVVLLSYLDANSFTDVINTHSSARYTAANM